MKRTLLLCLAVFCFSLFGSSVRGQQYIPLSYSSPYPQNLVEYQGNGCFAQDTNGTIFGGFSHGIFEFDGKRKVFHPTESPVLSLTVRQNRVWTATQTGFGFLETRTDGSLFYKDISTPKLSAKERPGDDLFAKVFAVKNKIYVYYPGKLYIINPDDLSFTSQSLKTGEMTTLGAFTFKNELYLSFADKGICRFDNGKFIPILSNDLLGTHFISYFSDFDGNNVLLAMKPGNLFYLFNGKELTPYAAAAGEAFASTNDEITGLVVTPTLVLASTSLNGCIVIDKVTGQPTSLLNNRYGIPSNEINGLFSDREGRVWMAHNDQISWNYVNFPINKYDQGYSGNVNDVIQTDNIYIATDNGLYYFTQTRNVDVMSEGFFKSVVSQFSRVKPTVIEKVAIPDIPVKKVETIQQELTQTSKIEAPKTDVTKEAKGGVLGFLKGKKKKEQLKQEAEEKRKQEEYSYQQEQERIRREAEAIAQAQAQQAEIAKQEAIRKNAEAEAIMQREMAERQRMMQMYEEMKASRQVQSKIIDFDIVRNSPIEKFNCLINYNGTVLAGSVNAIYSVSANNCERLVPLSVKQMLPSVKYPDRVYYLTPDNHVGFISNTGTGWVSQELHIFKEYITSLAENAEGDLWLGSMKGSIRLESVTPPAKINRLSPINNLTGSAQSVIVRQMENRVVLFQNHKAFTYENKSFRELPVLSALSSGGSNYRLAKGSGQNYWFLTGKNLYKLVSDKGLTRITVSDSAKILALTESINAFFVDDKDQIWLGDNQRVLNFIPSKMTMKEPHHNKKFRTVIRSVQTVLAEDGKTIRSAVKNLDETLELPYAGHYNIEFEFSAPAFDNSTAVKYEYKLGDDENWKTIEVNKLNLEFEWGEYVLRVRAIDAFGNYSEEAVYRFEIDSPFWAKWYFWLAIVAVLGVAVVKYVQFRSKALIKRKEELEAEVARATEKIRDQNMELEKSNGLLQEQSIALIEQNDKLEKFNVEITKQKEEIAVQRELSESLLLNILPVQIAEELKLNNKAEARRYDLVSVLFTDFKGFTMAAEKMTPEQLVVELNECFMKFDEIIDKYQIEKIKTLGDGYMCAGGVPTPDLVNPINMVLAGLEIQSYMNNFAEERRKQHKTAWLVRLGIHSGELVAGVVGKKKFAYDIWGDTVNTASRMESSGEAGKVNISGVTYELVKDFFECTYRGKIPAKNKGEISMYFVEGIKKELSVGGTGQVPNEKFHSLFTQFREKMSKNYRISAKV